MKISKMTKIAQCLMRVTKRQGVIYKNITSLSQPLVTTLINIGGRREEKEKRGGEKWKYF